MTEPAKTYRRSRARLHSWRRLALAALVAPLMAWPPVTAHAGKRIHPSWMEADASRKKVEFMLVSGWNANNAALNYNGYFKGGMTLVVPVGWRVEITLRNQDGNYPHSIVVTIPHPPDAIPKKAGYRNAAIKRAFTTEPEKGLFANTEDTLRFKTKKPGKFHLFCGVPGHGRGGMWTLFESSDQADAPYVLIADGVEPGRE